MRLANLVPENENKNEKRMQSHAKSARQRLKRMNTFKLAQNSFLSQMVMGALNDQELTLTRALVKSQSNQNMNNDTVVYHMLMERHIICNNNSKKKK